MRQLHTWQKRCLANSSAVSYKEANMVTLMSMPADSQTFDSARDGKAWARHSSDTLGDPFAVLETHRDPRRCVFPVPPFTDCRLPNVSIYRHLHSIPVSSTRDSHFFWGEEREERFSVCCAAWKERNNRIPCKLKFRKRPRKNAEEIVTKTKESSGCKRFTLDFDSSKTVRVSIRSCRFLESLNWSKASVLFCF
jgi:hypothetical protein